MGKASLPYLNQLVDLEYLDIWDTKITLEDLAVLNQLKNLKEVYISSAIKVDHGSIHELYAECIGEHLIVLKDIFPNSTVFVDFKK